LVPAQIQNVVSSINADDISQTYEDSNRKAVKYVDFNDPTPVWRRSCKKRLRISANGLYCQKLELLTYIFAADSVGLCLLIFTQLSLKAEPPEFKTSGTKTEFGVK